MLGNSWVAAQFAATQEGLSSMSECVGRQMKIWMRTEKIENLLLQMWMRTLQLYQWFGCSSTSIRTKKNTCSMRCGIFCLEARRAQRNNNTNSVISTKHRAEYRRIWAEKSELGTSAVSHRKSWTCAIRRTRVILYCTWNGPARTLLSEEDIAWSRPLNSTLEFCWHFFVIVHDTSPATKFLVSSTAPTATLVKLLVCTLEVGVKLMSSMS
jgi:hypothetical protein